MRGVSGLRNLELALEDRGAFHDLSDTFGFPVSGLGLFAWRSEPEPV